MRTSILHTADNSLSRYFAIPCADTTSESQESVYPLRELVTGYPRATPDTGVALLLSSASNTLSVVLSHSCITRLYSAKKFLSTRYTIKVDEIKNGAFRSVTVSRTLSISFPVLSFRYSGIFFHEIAFRRRISVAIVTVSQRKFFFEGGVLRRNILMLRSVKLSRAARAARESFASDLMLTALCAVLFRLLSALFYGASFRS